MSKLFLGLKSRINQLPRLQRAACCDAGKKVEASDEHTGVIGFRLRVAIAAVAADFRGRHLSK